MDTQLEKRLFTFAQLYADDHPTDADFIMCAEHALTNARLILDQVDHLLLGMHKGTTPQETEALEEVKKLIRVWRLTFVNWKDIS